MTTDSHDGLRGARALVTGANGGIGRAICEALTGAGAEVVRSDRTVDTESADEAWKPVDASDEESIIQLIRDTIVSIGRIDLLVTAHGVQLRRSAIQTSVAEWEYVQNINLRGVFLICKEAFPYLERNGGAIVNIASMTSVIALRDTSAYATSKAGVAQLTRSLALEWAPYGIRVNAVAPGYVKTPMTVDVLSDPARVQWILERIPLGRLADPADIAQPVLFLLSSAARYITGQTLFVDGGWTATA